MNHTHKDQVKEAGKKLSAWVLLGSLGLLSILGLSGELTASNALGIVLVLAFCSALIVSGFWRNIHYIAAVPYVLPVREQIAALPAEAVLLRGSDQPTATPEELLRAAQVGKETNSQELLRAESRTE